MSAKYTFWAWAIKLQKAPLKLTLLKLADNANDDGVSWYSVPKMAEHCGMSDRAFQGHLKTLVDMGLLKINERPGTSCVYHLQYHEAHLIAPQNLRHTPADISGVPPQNLRHTPAESADDPNNEPNNRSVNGTSSDDAAAKGNDENGKNVPHQAVIDLYHKNLPMLAETKVWNDRRRKALKARWFSGLSHPEHGGINELTWWDAYFAYVARCPHLIGENDRGWAADLEWLINETNLIKVIEGRYSR